MTNEIEVETLSVGQNKTWLADRSLFFINVFLLVYLLLSYLYLHSYFECAACLMLCCISLTLIRTVRSRSIFVTLYLIQTIVLAVGDVGLTQVVGTTGEIRQYQLKALNKSASFPPNE